MEVFIKIFNGKLIKIFDTKKDKRKQITLTTVEDFQKEAEANFYIDNKKIKTLIFNNLPKAKARVLDLPVSIKLTGSNILNLSYAGHDKQIEKYSINLNEYHHEENKINPGLITGGLIALGSILLITLLIFFIGIYINNNKNITTYEKEKIDKELIMENITENVNNEKLEDENTPDEKMDNYTNEILNEEKENELKKEIEEEKYDIIKLRNIINQNTPIYFFKDKTELLPGENNKINKINTFLKNYSSVEIIISGHTESINKPQNELKLSIKRAEKIKKLIKLKQIEKNITINTKGHGSTKMVLPNADEKNKFKNRRVEIKVISAE